MVALKRAYVEYGSDKPYKFMSVCMHLYVWESRPSPFHLRHMKLY